MSHESRSPTIAWLLLRDGHVAPITGLDPESIKNSAERLIEREGLKLKRGRLEAIVDSLGFDGDFGDYKNRRWPDLERRLAERGLAEYRNLFEVENNDLIFHTMNDRRRALADRVFLGPKPTPRRAFTGYGHDWERWDRRFDQLGGGRWRPDDDAFEPRDLEQTRLWVLRHRFQLIGIHNFFGDQLLDLGTPGTIDATLYHPRGADPHDVERTWHQLKKVTAALRWFLDHRKDGWVELVPITDRLVVLAGPKGTYDLIWRNLREEPPPNRKSKEPRLHLLPVDLPSTEHAKLNFQDWNYHRLDAWKEKEEHEAEKYYYANGGQAGGDYAGSDVIIERYLRAQRISKPRRRMTREQQARDGFVRVEVPGGGVRIASEMITVGEYRRFLEETGYLERRSGESWSAANDGNKDIDPVGVTYPDALAFCAWKERSLGVAVRLFTIEEHRALRPIASDHYKRLTQMDFPWENFPPRMGLEPSVIWSEPRFLDPGPSIPEFPEPSGAAHGSRKRWIASENWPPKALWRDPLPWVNHFGLQFIDAWDAYEWCADGRIAGHYWEGMIGVRSWGEYKNIKVGFRLVIDQEVRDDPAR